jgi:hypothetical protein
LLVGLEEKYRKAIAYLRPNLLNTWKFVIVHLYLLFRGGVTGLLAPRPP